MVVDVDDELAFVEYLKWEYKFEEASHYDENSLSPKTKIGSGIQKPDFSLTSFAPKCKFFSHGIYNEKACLPPAEN